MMDITTATSALFNTLTPAQYEAATATGPVVVLAGAGTGKTKTLVAGIVHRLQARAVPASRILAVTFTNKAAGEMRDRVQAELGPDQAPSWMGTFHGHGRRMLRTDPEIAGLMDGFEICDAEDSRSLVKRLLKTHLAQDEDAYASPDALRKRVKRIADTIAHFKDDLVLPQEAQAAVKGIIHQRQIEDPDERDVWHAAAALYPHYQRMLRDENKADFGDLLFWPTWTMRHDESYRKLWAERFSCLLADEFQDTNRCQYLWLEALTRDHHELFVVGDDAQSIYGWRGANIGFIRNFCREFPSARMIALEQNFRSTGHILDAANAVIARDAGRLDKKLYTTSGQGRPIDIIRCTGAEHEAQTIVTQITQRAMAGMPYDSMALLYRYNYLSRKVEEELIRAHIPYELVNDTAFWQRATIKDALAFLSLSTRPDEWQSNDAFRRVVNVPTRGVGPKAMARIEEKAAETGFSLFAAAEALTEKATSKAGQKLRAFLDAIREIECHPDIRLAARLQMGCEMTGYAEKLRSEGEKGQVAFENLAELYDLAQGFESVEELLDHAALGSLPKADQGLGCVRLSTIHAAKGLEFEHVYLMGWEDGAFPSTTNTDQGEERRLAYVALTRAKRRAVITWVGYRYGQETAPSPFLSDFPASAYRALGGGYAADHHAQTRRAQREALGF